MILENNDKKILIFNANTNNNGEEISDDINARELLLEIRDAIEEGGYNPVSQIVGYIISEDPTHIANYNNARTLIGKIDRDDLLEDMVRYYIDRIEKENTNNDN